MQEFWYIGYSVFLSLVDATVSGQSEIKIDNYSLWLRRFFNYMGWNIGMNFWLMYNLCIFSNSVFLFYEIIFFFTVGKLRNELNDSIMTEENTLIYLQNSINKIKEFLEGFGYFLFFYFRYFIIQS